MYHSHSYPSLSLSLSRVRLSLLKHSSLSLSLSYAFIADAQSFTILNNNSTFTPFPPQSMPKDAAADRPLPTPYAAFRQSLDAAPHKRPARLSLASVRAQPLTLSAAAAADDAKDSVRNAVNLFEEKIRAAARAKAGKRTLAENGAATNAHPIRAGPGPGPGPAAKRAARAGPAQQSPTLSVWQGDETAAASEEGWADAGAWNTTILEEDEGEGDASVGGASVDASVGGDSVDASVDAETQAPTDAPTDALNSPLADAPDEDRGWADAGAWNITVSEASPGNRSQPGPTARRGGAPMGNPFAPPRLSRARPASQVSGLMVRELATRQHRRSIKPPSVVRYHGSVRASARPLAPEAVRHEDDAEEGDSTDTANSSLDDGDASSLVCLQVDAFLALA